MLAENLHVCNTHLGAFKVHRGGRMSAALGRVGHAPLKLFPHDHAP